MQELVKSFDLAQCLRRSRTKSFDASSRLIGRVGTGLKIRLGMDQVSRSFSPRVFWQTRPMTSGKTEQGDWERFSSWIVSVQDMSRNKEGYPLAEDSILAGDEAGMPEGVSVAAVARSLLDSAVDDLASAYTLAALVGRLSPVGIPTLVRGSIELAGLGMWVLTGKERAGRQERALRVAHDSYLNARKFYEQIANDSSVPADVRKDAARGASDNRSQCDALAASSIRQGLKKSKVTATLNRTEALREVDAARGTGFLSNWQLCSGFAHGLAWASQFFHKKVYTHAMAGGGMLTSRAFDEDRVLIMLHWGRAAIEEFSGTFAAGRMPAPGMGSRASLISAPKAKVEAAD